MHGPPRLPRTWDQTAFVVFPGASKARPAHTICERPCATEEVADILRLWATPVAYRTSEGDILYWWPNGEVRWVKADGTDYRFPAKPDVASMPWTAAELRPGEIIDYTKDVSIYWGPEKEASRYAETPYSYFVSVETASGIWDFVQAHTFGREELGHPPFERFGCSRFVRRSLRPAAAPVKIDTCAGCTGPYHSP